MEQELSAQTQNVVTVGYERGLQYGQGKVSAYVKVFEGTNGEDVARLLGEAADTLRDLVASVNQDFDSLIEPVREQIRQENGNKAVVGVERTANAPAPRQTAPAARAAAPAAGGVSYTNETVTLRVGRQRTYSVKHFTGTKGDARVSVAYDDLDDPKQRRVFNEYTGQNGYVSALDAFKNTVKFEGGVYTTSPNNKFYKGERGQGDLGRGFVDSDEDDDNEPF